ncbi:hypothetical protein L7F22_011353 [Adiantum nelumboides]|nr:hypothetical protein [Adiantum nelumboides]
MALDDEEPRLPGELPPPLRRLYRHSYPADHVSAERSICTSSPQNSVAEVVQHSVQSYMHTCWQENQVLEGNDGNLFKVVERLENIMDRLMTNCKVKPKFDKCMDAGDSAAEEPSSLRDMEGRLDKIIQRMSQGGYFSRCSKEVCTTPAKEGMSAQAVSSRMIASSEKGARPPPKAQSEDELDSAATFVSSFRLPLLTPRSLLSKFGSSEKVDAFDSPTTTIQQSSGGRSKRFSAAFSFLSPPKRAGTVLSFRLGSSKPADDDPDRIK